MKILRLLLVWMVAALLLVTARGALAADSRAQFLYRQDGKLYLYDVGTKQATELPGIETGKYDTWKWSPDGQYLLITFSLKGDWTPSNYQTRLYDVDMLKWDETINVAHATGGSWSPDSQQFSYSMLYSKPIMANGRTIGDETWEELWIYDVQTSEPRRLYITPDHPIGAFNNRGIGESWWSPDSNYLLFVEWYSITGGSINDLNLLDVHSGKVLSLYGQYYASYYPVWSPDSKWILMPLQKVYLPHPELDRVDKEEQGDLYLYRAKDAQQFQLTSSPQTAEFNHRWSADGKTILFEQYDYSKRNPVIEAAQIELADVLEGSPVIKLKPFKKSPSPYQPNLGEYNYYSPDGLHMAYLNHYKDQTYHLFVADGNGSNWYFTGAKLKKPNYDFLGWRPGGATN